MKLFDIFRKKKPKETRYAEMLNGFTPIFSQFGNNIYASDVVQQAINCIVMEMKKLQPQHIRKCSDNQDILSVKDSCVQKVLDNPNPLMTTSEFLEKIVWQLFFNYNSFVIPTYDLAVHRDGGTSKNYKQFWPIAPSQVDFLESNDELFVKFQFDNNFETTLPYKEVIHIRYKYSVNEYMGGNENGQADNQSLIETLKLNDTLLKGVSKAMSSSFAINGVIKYNSLLDKEKMENNLRELEDHLKNNESGFLPLDLKGEFIPFNKNIELVDDTTLKFIDEKILRHFGVPLAILTGDYTKEQYEAFYQKTLEPLIISLSQSFTKALFSEREKTFGNKVMFYSKELIFMNINQKLEMIRLLGDSGALYENEKRVAFGLPPLEELKGIRTQSLNYVNVEYAKEYQTKTERMERKDEAGI